MVLFIFDIDGTLTDSLRAHLSSYLKTFADMGIEDFDRNWGGYRHYTDSWIFSEIFRGHFGRSPEAADRQAFAAAMSAHFRRYTEAEPLGEIPGARAFVETVQAGPGMACALATGSFRPAAIDKHRRIGLRIPPQLLVTASEFETREEIVLQAIAAARSYHGVKAFDAVISIGDGYWDMLTARNLGLEFVGISQGPAAEKLRAAGARNVYPDFLASGLRHPLDLLESLCNSD